MAVSQFEGRLANLVNAGFPYLFIPSYEEDRVVGAIVRTLENPELVKARRKVYTWTQTQGLVCPYCNASFDIELEGTEDEQPEDNDQ